MTEPRFEGITIEAHDGRIHIDVAGGHWEGTAAETERLLTTLHYVLARARPGTNIASMFVNGTLWGGKTIDSDPAQALDDVRLLLDQLSAKVSKLTAQVDEPPDRG